MEHYSSNPVVGLGRVYLDLLEGTPWLFDVATSKLWTSNKHTHIYIYTYIHNINIKIMFIGLRLEIGKSSNGTNIYIYIYKLKIIYIYIYTYYYIIYIIYILHIYIYYIYIISIHFRLNLSPPQAPEIAKWRGAQLLHHPSCDDIRQLQGRALGIVRGRTALEDLERQAKQRLPTEKAKGKAPNPRKSHIYIYIYHVFG